MSAQIEMKKILKILKKNVSKTIDPKIMRELGNVAAGMIKLRSRLGYGVSGSRGNVRRKKFAKLADSTVERRKKFSKLHGHTSPRKSNLTFRGIMLESMKVTSVNDGRVVVNVTGRNKGISNEDLAEIHEKGLGRVPVRRFLDLTIPEEKKVNRLYRQRFGDLVKKSLT